MPSVQFRSNPHVRISPLESFIYGDKTAVIMTNGVSFTIHVTKDVGIAQKGFKQFASAWEAAVTVAPQPEFDRGKRCS